MEKVQQSQKRKHRVKKQEDPIKECAVALKGENEVFMITDYPQWLKTGDKEDVIVFEDCDRDWLADKYLYWEHTINYKKYAI